MLRTLGTATLVAVCVWSTAAFGQVKLARKMAENSTVTTHTQSTTKQVLTIMGVEVPTDASTFVVTKSKTGARAADGTLRREDKVETLQVNLTINGIKVQFDSGDPNKAAENAALEPILDNLRATLKVPATSVYDKDNKITAIEFPKEQLDALSDQVKKEFDPEKRKKQYEQEQGSLPADPVKTGDTWERTTQNNIGGGQTLELVTEYTYVGPVTQDGKTLQKVTSKTKAVKYTMEDMPGAQAKVTAGELKPTESEGEFLFDLDLGRAVKEKSKIRIEGDMTIEINTMKLPAKLDLTIATESTVQP